MFQNYKKLTRHKDHFNFDDGRWANQGDTSTEFSFHSAEFNSFAEVPGTHPYDHGLLGRIKGILKTKEVHRLFNFGDSFGSGKYGIIKLVEKRNYSKIRFAMKTIPLERGYEDYVQREYDILCKLDHPFVMNMIEVYFSTMKQELHLVVPLYEGGEVQTQIEQRGCLSEIDSANILFQLLLALNYMHERKISHGDLKPENLVFESRFNSGRRPFVRLIDFGFAVDRDDALYQKYGIKSTEFGTPIYMAPEKLRN